MIYYRFEQEKSIEECLNLKRPPNVSQEISDFTSNTPVTLNNPTRVRNATSSAGNVAIRFGAETTYREVHLLAGKEIECDPYYIGSSANGTTITKILVLGVK